MSVIRSCCSSITDTRASSWPGVMMIMRRRLWRGSRVAPVGSRVTAGRVPVRDVPIVAGHVPLADLVRRRVLTPGRVSLPGVEWYLHASPTSGGSSCRLTPRSPRGSAPEGPTDRRRASRVAPYRPLAIWAAHGAYPGGLVLVGAVFPGADLGARPSLATPPGHHGDAARSREHPVGVDRLG